MWFCPEKETIVHSSFTGKDLSKMVDLIRIIYTKLQSTCSTVDQENPLLWLQRGWWRNLMTWSLPFWSVRNFWFNPNWGLLIYPAWSTHSGCPSHFVLHLCETSPPFPLCLAFVAPSSRWLHMSEKKSKWLSWGWPAIHDKHGSVLIWSLRMLLAIDTAGRHTTRTTQYCIWSPSLPLLSYPLSVRVIEIRV